MPLAPSTIERIVFIRQLYLNGVDVSRQPFPLGAIAILTFHDAVELFLELAAREKEARIRANVPFMEYFEAIDQTIEPERLAHKQSMSRLNSARRSLKHDGILPAAEEIERFRNSTADFFDDNTPAVFGIEFASASLIDFVADQLAKTLLQEAQRQIGANDTEGAIVHIARAFQIVWRNAHPQQRTGMDSAFDIARSAPGGENLSRLIEAIYREVSDVSLVVQKLALGIDPIKAAKFRQMVPAIAASPYTQNYQVQWPPTLETPTIDECQWALDFVVDVSIRIQKALVGSSR